MKSVPETRLSISIDTQLITDLQVVLTVKSNKPITKAEVVRIAVNELAKANNIAA
jgi:hypothetical protein